MPENWRHGELYVVCDRCGFLSCDEDDQGREFLCQRCGSTAAWVYPAIESALAFSRQVVSRQEALR